MVEAGGAHTGICCTLDLSHIVKFPVLSLPTLIHSYRSFPPCRLSQPRFCCFGDTINTASRLESTCPRPGLIHASHSTYLHLQVRSGTRLYFSTLISSFRCMWSGLTILTSNCSTPSAG